MKGIETLWKKINRFLSSLYFGDRYCKKIDITNDKIIFLINCISRLKPGTTDWAFYTDEDVDYGCLVFDEVKEYQVSSELPINEDIYNVKVESKENDIFTFIVEGSNFSNDLVSTDIKMIIKAKKVYIYNPNNNSIIYP